MAITEQKNRNSYGLLNSLRAAVWLEWQTRGNWTNPWLFTLYILGKPISAALVLVFMYQIVSGGRSNPTILGYLIVGSATWAFVDTVMGEFPRTVLSDREEYAMLKYVYIAPHRFITFLIGRATPRILMAAVAFTVTLSIGVVFLKIPIHIVSVNYLLLLVTMLIGFVSLIGFGVAFAGLALVLKRGAWDMSTAISGALYLVTGAIFPITILPGFLRDISLVIPLTYWIELTRRSVLGYSSPGMPSSWAVTLLIQIITTILVTTIAVIAYYICEHFAKERGQLDRATGN